jgi:hypothetical protein
VRFDCTLLRHQRLSSHSRIVWFLRQAGARELRKGFTRAMAARFISSTYLQK